MLDDLLDVRHGGRRVDADPFRTYGGAAGERGNATGELLRELDAGLRTFVAVTRKYFYSALLSESAPAYDHHRRSALTPDTEH